jgi:hypothetical protein
VGTSKTSLEPLRKMETGLPDGIIAFKIEVFI